MKKLDIGQYIKNKYIVEPVPLTKEQEKEAYRRGMVAGGTIAGMGGSIMLMGNTKGKHVTELKKNSPEVRKVVEIGAPVMIASGAALTAYSAYKHYKNKSEKEKEASEKKFTEVSSGDLLAEQMKLQRALMDTQKKKEVLRSEEARARLKASTQQQKYNQRANEATAKTTNKIAERTIEHVESGLYKTPSRPVPPVPMKI